MKNLISAYSNRYSISQLDLADSAETNRLHILFISPFLFAFGLGDLIVLSVLQALRGGERVVSFVYFGIFTLVSTFMFFYSRLIKKIDRSKAYYAKTAPVYLIIWTSMLASVYNFYFLGQPFNGVITYCITGLLTLMVFSTSPIPFFVAMLTGLLFLAPGVKKNFGVTGLLDTILVAVLCLCCSLYKRRTEKKYILLLKKQKNNLVAKTFGNFTLLYNDNVIKFSRTKSNELIAYLIYKNGSSVQTKELISVLYGDNADSARYGASLRNLIVDIKQSLSKLEIQKFFIAEYNNFRINPEVVKCDYYDFLTGDEKAMKKFAGEFMSQYSWAEETTGFLEMKMMRSSNQVRG